MEHGVFGLPVMTFITIVGVPLGIIILLAVWGFSFGKGSDKRTGIYKTKHNKFRERG